MNKMTIPYAIANYAEFRKRSFYYVDKTQHIVELENYKAPVFLRPRRFGKSLLCSMLAHYYDLRHASHFEDLFSGTYIGEHPTQEHNQYMVLRFDFSKMVMSDDIAGLELNFNQLNCVPIDNLATGPNHYGYLFPDFRPPTMAKSPKR